MRKHIYDHSALLQRLYELNTSYSNTFSYFQDSHESTHHCNSKAQFDKTNFDKLFHDYCAKNKEYLYSIIPLAHKNIYSFSEYEEKATAIRTDKSQYRSIIMQRMEWQAFMDAMLTPPISITVTIHNRYISPQGRNRYHNHFTFGMTNISSCLEDIEKENTFQQEKKRQRALLNDSLRYDILKRDNFTCQLCGASQKEGAKLHVDHIKPIAKGGQTVKSNLRTLCDRCNMGKKAKYDPYGPN